MSQTEQIAESLEGLLVSIAEGVREAQDALNGAPPLDAYGRPMPLYHMPYLDFEIQVEMETVTTESGGIRLRINPLGGKDSSKSTSEISSKISGRLVAIPPGEGVPVPVLNMLSERLSARQHKIIITATNSAGEILAGQAIELNINLPASQQLSALDDDKDNKNWNKVLPSMRTRIHVQDVILITDENGSAETIVDFDAELLEELSKELSSEELSKVSLVLTAELGTQNAHITLPAGNS
jgi:hypothetical protein